MTKEPNESSSSSNISSVKNEQKQPRDSNCIINNDKMRSSSTSNYQTEEEADCEEEGGNETNDDNINHDNYRIALYYCYIPIVATIAANSDSDNDALKRHIVFHETSCQRLDLHGRIRVSAEGINGVLSGLHMHLRLYEHELHQELSSLILNSNTVNEDNWELDVKYSHLRRDLNVSVQLFHELSIQQTKQVVSLVPTWSPEEENLLLASAEDHQQQQQKKKKKSSRKSRQQARRRIMSVQKQEQQQKQHEQSQTQPEHNPQAQHQEQQPSAHYIFTRAMTLSTTATASDSSSSSSSSPTAISPGVHLSPTEWNERLTTLSQQQNQLDQEQEQNMKKKPIVVDCRNVYESAVGYFDVPNVETLLTNTRKYSELTQIFIQEKERLQNASQIFMYCTGGVRCERASLFLNSLLTPQDEDQEENNNVNNGCRGTRPEIFQLHGGIQRYLEYTVGGGEGGAADSAAPPPSNVVVSKETAMSKTDQIIATQQDYDASQSDDSSQQHQHQQQQQQQQEPTCYFKGKNFVFDQRRLDPVFYKPQHAAAEPYDETCQNYMNSDNDRYDDSGIVGKCLVCAQPHDDFDNGHAPAENKEARCWNCRILILVCNTCRPKVSCWKPKKQDSSTNDNSDSNDDSDNNLPRMYCAGLEKPCFHKPPVHIILSKQDQRRRKDDYVYDR